MKKRGKKRILALVMTLALALSLLPVTALAANDVTLDLSQGSVIITATGYTQGNTGETAHTGSYTLTGDTTAHTVKVTDGTHDITLNGVNIEVSGTCAFAVGAGATANITLVDNNTLKSGANCAGLQVPAGAEVTIDGSGKLTATGGREGGGAGIGGGNGQTAGTISITGSAEVEATGYGGNAGAGIGGGAGGSGGKVTISGSAKVKAISTSGGTGAGIGGGEGGTGGTIIIRDSACVTATGGNRIGADKKSAGIGGGDITITGGTVKATGQVGAGIGDGNGGARAAGDKVTITGGTVTATSIGSGAGIGGSGIGGVDAVGGNVTITGGTVTATSESGAGIGSAQGGAGGNVTITGGTVTATSRSGAGIGGGSNSVGGNVSITGGTVKATGYVSVGPGWNETSFDTYIRTVALAAGSTGQEGTATNSLLLGTDGNFVSKGAIELPCDLTIPGGKTLTIPAGATLTVPSGKTLTNDGTINGNGTLTGDGGFGGGGTYTLKVSRTLAAPTASNMGQTSITLGTVAGKPDETVQYAIMNTANLPPAESAWQDSPVFDGLTAGATYYFFVRTTGSAIYADAVSPAAALTTASAPTPTPTPTPDRGSDDGGNSPSPAEQAASKVDKAKDGDTVEIALPSGGKLDGKILEAAAGKDVTLEISAGNGVTWIVNGKDVPAGQKLADLNLKVDAKANTIPVNVINAVTGEQKVMQLALSHNGAFPVPLTLRLDAGKDNAGLFANLYYYNETAGKLEYQSTAKIGPNGSAHLPFTHASSYAVVIGKESHAPTEPPFTDVKKGDWCYDAVVYVHQKGLMVGTTDTTFGPGGAVTRAQIWTVLARLAGQELSGSGVFEQARQWAVAQGVSDGANPTGAVTRQQLVAMLYRYAQSTGIDVSVGQDTNILSYGDASDVAEWAVPAFQWACGAGVVGGTADNRLDPQGGATRAQLAAILQRFMEST